MNYRKIYGNIVKKAKAENRKKSKEIYYERHHIIPTFMFSSSIRNKSGRNMGHISGDPDSEKNMVLLTAREHFLCHLLLYKFLKGTRYEYAAGASLVLFFNVAGANHKRVSQGGFFSLGKRYEKYRQEGIRCISECRKNTFPCVDAKTGKSMGSLNKEHPKVISGEYVHHSKGKHSYYNPESNERIWCKVDDDRVLSGQFRPVSADNRGMKNNNALVELTTEMARKITLETYYDQRDNRNIFSEQGHLHKSFFEEVVFGKLKLLFPKRKGFAVVYAKRMGETIVDFLNRELGLKLIRCDLQVKFPKVKR
ncbi:MAG: hypothetical protein ACYDG4_17230 [Desulfuromonadaceae bacterium]